jgi:hypothetical protein
MFWTWDRTLDAWSESLYYVGRKVGSAATQEVT